MEGSTLYKLTVLMISLLLFVCFSGCNTMGARGVRVADNFGRAYEMNVFTQTVNPDAGREASPVDALDGKAVEHIYKNYQKTFTKSQTPSTVINMNIGK